MYLNGEKGLIDSTRIVLGRCKVDVWSIGSSIFKENILGIEDKLMTSLQKCSIEFRDMQDTFEITIKYQHYGMCTRLLRIL